MRSVEAANSADAVLTGEGIAFMCVCGIDVESDEQMLDAVAALPGMGELSRTPYYQMQVCLWRHLWKARMTQPLVCVRSA